MINSINNLENFNISKQDLNLSKTKREIKKITQDKKSDFKNLLEKKITNDGPVNVKILSINENK